MWVERKDQGTKKPIQMSEGSKFLGVCNREKADHLLGAAHPLHERLFMPNSNSLGTAAHGVRYPHEREKEGESGVPRPETGREFHFAAS